VRTSLADNLLLLSLLCPSLVLGQNLGDAARKEQERRKKNKQAGVQAKVITDEDLAAKRGTSGPAKDGTTGAAATDEGAGAAPAPMPEPAAEESAPPDPASDRATQEAHWRQRADDARAEVARAEAVVAEMEKLWLVEGESYVDSEGKTVIRDLQHLRQLMARAKGDLARAKKAQEDLYEEARRSGALPGWLR
jgi:hypothetical protein